MSEYRDKILNTAKSYYNQGLSIIPVIMNEKKAAIKWESAIDGQIPWTTLEPFWTNGKGCGIAIITGSVNKLSVIDADTEEAAEEFRKVSPGTYAVKTPKGYHFYFKYNKQILQGVGIRPGLDVRNDRGYVVAPPTVIGGRHYEQCSDYGADPVELSEEALEYLFKVPTKSLETATDFIGQSKLDFTENGGARNASLFSVLSDLASVGRYRDSLILVAQQLWVGTPDSGELQTLVDSALKTQKGSSN